MKNHKPIKTAGAILALTVAAGSLAAFTPNANAQAAPATAKGQATQIVFVPNKMLEENKVSNKLKENTFYWSNQIDDAAQGPKVADDGGTPYLLLKGTGDEKAQKTLTAVNLVRVYNVPADAQSVTVLANVKANYDEWVDNIPGWITSPGLSFSFYKDGKQARKTGLLERRNSRAYTPNNPNTAALTYGSKDWTMLKTTVPVPAGAQQLVVTATADFAANLSIASLEANFSNQPYNP